MSTYMLTIREVMLTQDSWETHEIYHPIIASEILTSAILLVLDFYSDNNKSFKSQHNKLSTIVCFLVYWLVDGYVIKIANNNMISLNKGKI